MDAHVLAARGFLAIGERSADRNDRRGGPFGARQRKDRGPGHARERDEARDGVARQANEGRPSITPIATGRPGFIAMRQKTRVPTLSTAALT